MAQRFSATMDGQAKTITFVVLVIVLIPIISIISLYGKEHDPWLLLGPVVVVIALIVAALYRPKAYKLGLEGLDILRPIGELNFPLHRFRSVSSITSKELGFGIRTFGSGGFLGYFGKFYYKNYGHINLYVCDREKMLLIILDDERKIIVSPDDPEAFMSAFHELMKR
jgi:hypothetical protein